MLALIILFLFAVATLFVAFLKKPKLTLATSVIGLVLTGVSLICNWYYPCDFLTSYQGVNFDGFAMLFSLIAIGFTLLILFSGVKQLNTGDHLGDHLGLIMFSLFGGILMVSYQNLFIFFLGLEILSIPIYVMAGSKKDSALSSESSLKYFITGAFASGVLLFGIAWLYGATASFELIGIRSYFETAESISSIAYLGVLFIMASFLFKISVAPFHFWAPDVYDGAPATVTNYMATVIKLVGFGAFLKLFFSSFIEIHGFWSPILVALSVATMFIGNLSAIRQIRFKRFISYSGIAHVGYALLTFIVISENSAFNLWYYLFGYGVATIALITTQTMVNDREDRIEAFKGIGRSNPFVALVAVVALLALAGVPPLMGFFGKYLVFVDAIFERPVLVIFALINSGISIYYYLRVIILILQKPTDDEKIVNLNVSILQLITLALCLLALLFGGFILMM